MSTLTSSDFGELKRPTTRVHAPPGGGSSWSIGGDDPMTGSTQTTSHSHRKRGGIQNSPRKEHAPIPSPAPVAAPPAAPIAVSTLMVTSPVLAPASPKTIALGGRSVRVALVKTKTDAEIVDGMLYNCIQRLQQNRAVTAETFTVSTVDELPYAANKLTQMGGYEGVICFGFLNATDPSFQALSTCLTQSFIDISVRNVKPVVRALFAGEPRAAALKVQSGFGAEFAENIDVLVNLGTNQAAGFVAPVAPVVAATPVQAAQAAASQVTQTPVKAAAPSFQPKYNKRKQYGAGESSIVFG